MAKSVYNGRMICSGCGVVINPPKNSVPRKYCSNKCQQNHQINIRTEAWLNGDNTVGASTVKTALKKLRGNSCEVCGISEWNGKPLVLELEHKNGNSDDNSPTNVCLICPNCHSQTPTYKNRNKGNGRHWRRQRYREGKSY